MLYQLTNKSAIFRCLLLLLAVAMLSATASAYDFSSGVLCYNINSDGKSVSVVSHLSASGAVTIPATVKNGSKTYSVTAIGESAFRKCTGLTKITFPTSLTAIEAFAFSECTGLTEVTIPATLKSLGHHSFYGCTGMAKVVWNAPNFGPVDNNAVSPCHFLNCTNIKSFVFGNNVTSIPNYLCDGLTGLTTVTIPATVTKIGIYAFERCYNLTTVNWNAVNCQDTPNGFSPFGDGKKIKTITFASNIKRIPSQLCRHMTALTSVTIPATVTEIGEYAFEDTGLTSVTIPAAVTTVGNFAFRNCANLTKVIWNATNCKDNESFGGRFNGCPKLTTLQFGTTVTRIPAALCRYTENLKSVTLPNSLTEIGEEAFKNCEALTEVTAGTGLKTVKDNAFDECTALTKVNITNLAAWCGIDFSTAKSNPLYYAKKLYLNGTLVTSLTIPNVTVVKNYTFYNCTSITELTVPKTVTSFSGSSMFTGCTGLKKVVWNSPYYKEYSFYSFRPFDGLDGIQTISFAGSVTKISPYMCYGLKGLTTVTINASVTMVGKKAFVGCTNLTTVNWNAANCDDFADISYPYSNLPFYDLTNLKQFNFGNTVTRIPKFLCYGLSGLTNLSLPNSVTVIGEGAFAKCTGLTEVTIPESVTSIERWSFDSCDNLNRVNWNVIDCGNGSYEAAPFKNLTDLSVIKTFVFGDKVQRIPGYLCRNMTGLTEVTIPKSVTYIGSEAFNGCTGLTRVNISDLTAWCNISFGSNPLSCAHNLYLNGTLVTDLVIPDTATRISNNAFEGGTCLVSVSIPNSVTTIGSSAFNSCTGLVSITIPNSVTSIGGNAFRHCDGLTTMEVAADNTVYDSRDNCNAIIQTATNTLMVGCKNSTIPNTVTKIGDNAFSNCIGLTAVTIPNSVTTIGTYTFVRCSALETVEFGNSVATIGWCAFQDCNTLKAAALPNSVTLIEAYAFSRCSAMTELVIGNSVARIRGNAFNGCSGLQTVTSRIVEPQNITYESPSGIFGGVPQTCVLRVPKGTIDNYQLDRYNGAANPWLTFSNIEEYFVDGDLNSDGAVDVGDVNTVLDDILATGGTTLTLDVNGDGVVDVGDVNAILERILALSNP